VRRIKTPVRSKIGDKTIRPMIAATTSIARFAIFNRRLPWNPDEKISQLGLRCSTAIFPVYSS
jgi:hypothetical protein